MFNIFRLRVKKRRGKGKEDIFNLFPKPNGDVKMLNCVVLDEYCDLIKQSD
ncbi:hypothetical protein FDUTEX481_08659 [Tolypothrix sp. PCC 7601]|nr:hypothetical protein FDUTEX481_08659 [Tolypothrix sp. PCC 7601]